MLDSTNELQKELKSRIESATSLKVYDNVPETAIYPYITFGNIFAYSAASKDIRFTDYSITLHIWSRSNGQVECRTICDTIALELDNTALSNITDKLPVAYFTSSTVVRDVDNITQHGILRFAIKE